MKWLWIILLIIVGIVAAIFAYEYLSTGIGHLPSWIPGHVTAKAAVDGKCPNSAHLSNGMCYTKGHERKRGYLCLLIAVAAFVGAGWLIYKERGASSGGSTPAAAA